MTRASQVAWLSANSHKRLLLTSWSLQTLRVSATPCAPPCHHVSEALLFLLCCFIAKGSPGSAKVTHTGWPDIFTLSLHFPFFITDSFQITESPYIKQTSSKTHGKKMSFFEGAEHNTVRESEKDSLLMHLAPDLAVWLLKQLELQRLSAA